MAEMMLEMPQGASVSSALTGIGKRTPAIRDLLARAAVAVNREYVKADHVLKDGDELALIPPVSGGAI